MYVVRFSGDALEVFCFLADMHPAGPVARALLSALNQNRSVEKILQSPTEVPVEELVAKFPLFPDSDQGADGAVSL